jgi:hypothetical protein
MWQVPPKQLARRASMHSLASSKYPIAAASWPEMRASVYLHEHTQAEWDIKRASHRAAIKNSMTEDDESSRRLIFTPESGLCNPPYMYKLCVKRQVRWKRPQRVGHRKHFFMKLYNSIYTLTHTQKATRFAASTAVAGDGGVVVQFRAESRKLFTGQVRRFRIEPISVRKTHVDGSFVKWFAARVVAW